MHGLAPLGYHLVNLLLHLIVTQLYYATCRHYVNQQVQRLNVFSYHFGHLSNCNIFE